MKEHKAMVITKTSIYRNATFYEFPGITNEDILEQFAAIGIYGVISWMVFE